MSYAKNEDRGDRGDRGDRNGGAGAFRGRKVCRFCADSTVKADYKNPSMLKNYLTDRGKLTPARVTGNCAKHQRALATAVRRARVIALMPFTVTGR
ncbi:MAG: 30S ribosomal protein S18 [Kofleriaceae bacterium]|nr:30S ribosomal protein S18 [Kofleriaceae bacterium]